MSDSRMTRNSDGVIRPSGKKDFLGLSLTTGMTGQRFHEWLDEAVEKGAGGLLAFVNPSAWAVAARNPAYASDLARFDLVLPDGYGVVVGARILGVDIPERFSFDSTSLAGPVFRRCVANGLRVALIGAAPGVAERASEVLREAFPGLQIRYVRDGYFEDFAPIAQRLVDLDIDVVVCGMGVPRQESAMLGLRDSGWRGLAFGCGGFLDQLHGGLDYYPPWVDTLNLRFAYRIAKEPRRLWRRYLIDYQCFIRLVLQRLARERKGVRNRKAQPTK